MTINYTMLLADALGFTIALAWNDAVSKLIHRAYPNDGQGTNMRATIIYALVITVLVVIIVALYNHCRKALHGAGFTSAAIVRGGVTTGTPPIGEPAPPGYPLPDPDAIVQLWTPPV